ncbi:hypothetical protein MLD38_040362 [Melastoma candidum]|uniref:Uncharacterized protein n=1 Tax=Melastoma candidum TaxID=119954 RepID=A0ACB9L6C5_9MYRT|nr:hypothetical protein MLD38_040362 [Melastoma candidum]
MEGSEGGWSSFREVHKASSLPYAIVSKVSSLPFFMESKEIRFDEFVLHHGDVGLTVAEKQKFAILEVILNWLYMGSLGPKASGHSKRSDPTCIIHYGWWSSIL